MVHLWAAVVLKSCELSLGLISVCACDRLLLPQSQILAKNSSLLTLWKACKNMTQPVNANAAPNSSWETDVPAPLASQSSTSSPPSPIGLSPVQLTSSFSQEGGGTECVVSTLALQLRVSNYHWQLWVVFMAEPFFWAVFVSCPLKNPAGITENDQNKRKLEFCFLHCSRLYI